MELPVVFKNTNGKGKYYIVDQLMRHHQRAQWE